MGLEAGDTAPVGGPTGVEGALSWVGRTRRSGIGRGALSRAEKA